MQQIFHFGAYRVHPASRTLWRDSDAVNLRPTEFDVLLCLLENRGKVVETDMILRRVWPGVTVSLNNVAQVVARLRRSLGQDPSGQEYIRTIHRRGYYLAAAVYMESLEEVEIGPQYQSVASTAPVQP